MSILNGFNSDLFSGHRVIRVNSWEEFTSLQIPPDCELMAIHATPDKNYIYMKSNTTGNLVNERYHFEPDPVEEFDPKKYVTVDQFNELREEITDGFNSIKQSIATNANANANASGNGTKSYSGNK